MAKKVLKEMIHSMKDELDPIVQQLMHLSENDKKTEGDPVTNLQQSSTFTAGSVSFINTRWTQEGAENEASKISPKINKPKTDAEISDIKKYAGNNNDKIDIVELNKIKEMQEQDLQKAQLYMQWMIEVGVAKPEHMMTVAAFAHKKNTGRELGFFC